MKDNRSRADNRPASQKNPSENNSIRPHLHSIRQNRNRAIFHPLSKSHPVPQDASRTDFATLVDHQTRPVLERKSRPHLRPVIQLDSHDPMHQDHIAPQNRNTHRPERGIPYLLAQAKKHHHETAFGISVVCLPVLEDSVHFCDPIGLITTFFIPEHHLPDKERRAAWEGGRIPSLLGGGKSASAQAWLFQTWAEVRDRTHAVLSTNLPDEGIVITLSNFLPPAFRASKNQFIAAVAADFLPHPGTQLQILQNAAHARRLPGSIFMPHWPQPNLIPRNPTRDDRFETLAYFGDSQNLAPEIQSQEFQKELQIRSGLRLEIRPPDCWHDYSDIDVVLAVRDFSRASHLHKPATKLYNAWIAGVPLVSGHESAIGAEGVDGLDHIRTDSPLNLLECLERLKNDIPLRKRLVSEGQKKTAARNRDAVRELWMDLLVDRLPRSYGRWHSSTSMSRRLFYLSQRSRFFFDRIFRS